LRREKPAGDVVLSGRVPDRAHRAQALVVVAHDYIVGIQLPTFVGAGAGIGIVDGQGEELRAARPEARQAHAGAADGALVGGRGDGSQDLAAFDQAGLLALADKDPVPAHGVDPRGAADRAGLVAEAPLGEVVDIAQAHRLGAAVDLRIGSQIEKLHAQCVLIRHGQDTAVLANIHVDKVGEPPILGPALAEAKALGTIAGIQDPHGAGLGVEHVDPAIGRCGHAASADAFPVALVGPLGIVDHQPIGRRVDDVDELAGTGRVRT